MITETGWIIILIVFGSFVLLLLLFNWATRVSGDPYRPTCACGAMQPRCIFEVSAYDVVCKSCHQNCHDGHVGNEKEF